jgi:hypothetical protein
MLLADHIETQAELRKLTVCKVDGSQTAAEMAALIERHFEPLLRRDDSSASAQALCDRSL